MNTVEQDQIKWSCKTLKESLAVLKDGTHFSPQSFGGKNLYITSKNIRMGKLDLEDVCYIPVYGSPKIGPLRSGDC